jgi:ribosomal protein L34E
MTGTVHREIKRRTSTVPTCDICGGEALITERKKPQIRYDITCKTKEGASTASICQPCLDAVNGSYPAICPTA